VNLPRTDYTNTTSTGQIAKQQLHAELTAMYHSLHATIDAMGKTLLEIMRHPEVSNEQLDEARLKYFTSYAMWIAARMELRKRYPDQPGRGMWQKELPWNTKE
jgi:hypothetical protein